MINPTTMNELVLEVSVTRDSSFINSISMDSYTRLQFIIWSSPSPPVMASPILVGARFNYTSSLRRYFIGCNYLIRMTSIQNDICRFKVPNRVLHVCLLLSNIQCANSNSYKCNLKRPGLRLPKTILTLDLTWSKIFRPPTGLFILIYITSYKSMLLRTRESILCITHDYCPAIKFTYLPKSTNNLYGLGFPRNKILSETNGCNLYNTRYKITKKSITDKFGCYTLYKLRDPVGVYI